jgi:hypothetical protein
MKEEWFDAVENSMKDLLCFDCGDSPHVEIDTRMRCCTCGRDNGQADWINASLQDWPPIGLPTTGTITVEETD